MERDKAKNILNKYMNLKNAKLVETHIFEISSKNSDILSYEDILYEVIGFLIDQLPVDKIIKNLQQQKIAWNNDVFYDITLRIKEQNDFIKNPFEVEEGVFECKAINPKTGKICGSRRVYSYSIQDRSCDEGTSVYAQCVTCKAQWRERG